MKLELNSNLSQKAMLCTLRTSALRATTYDRVASEELTDQHQAERESARVYKRLIKKEHLKEINSLISQAYSAWKRATMPWSDFRGTRICPATKYFELSQIVQQCKTELKTVAIPNFIPKYNGILAEAQQALGTLWNPNDFVPASELADRWTIDISFSPLPNVNDWRVAIGDEELARVKAETSNEFARSIRGTVLSLYERIIGSVEEKRGLAYVVETLSTKDKVFRDSLINNISDMCQLARELNITGDADLEAMISKVQVQIAYLNPKEIREDEALREDTAKKAQAIVDQMSAFMTAANNE